MEGKKRWGAEKDLCSKSSERTWHPGLSASRQSWKGWGEGIKGLHPLCLKGMYRLQKAACPWGPGGKGHLLVLSSADTVPQGCEGGGDIAEAPPREPPAREMLEEALEKTWPPADL